MNQEKNGKERKKREREWLKKKKKKRPKGKEISTTLFAISEPVKFKIPNRQLAAKYLSLGFK